MLSQASLNSARRPPSLTVRCKVLCAAQPTPRTSANVYRCLSSLSSVSSFCGTKLCSTAVAQRARRQKPIGEVCRTATQRATASFFGVGAPEALVIAVVALLVFGPKGLAEAAAGLGKTLRAFQPTIRELADVSNELKSTLEKEIGLDEVKAELRRPPSSASSTSTVTTDTAVTGAAAAGANPQLVQVTDEIAKAVDPEIERKRKEAEQMAWGGAAPQQTAAAAPADAALPTAGGVSGGAASAAGAVGGMQGLSVEELERELARRKAAAAETNGSKQA